MTYEAYDLAPDLLTAIRLNRDFIRRERVFAAKYPDDYDYGEGKTYRDTLRDFEEALVSASRIWREEMDLTPIRQRIAERIRAELPEDYHYIADCVEANDYADMAL